MELNCIKEKLANELAERDKAAEELQNLQKNLTAAQTELETVRAELGRTLTKSEEALKAGRALDRIDSRVNELTRRRDILLDRIDLLHRQDGRGWAGLIETAGKALSDADHRLAAAVVRALGPAKRDVADEMSQDFCRGMARYDSYNDGCSKLFQELHVSGLTAGSLELAPLPSCPALAQLIENGFLVSGRPVAVSEPLPVEAETSTASEPVSVEPSPPDSAELPIESDETAIGQPPTPSLPIDSEDVGGEPVAPEPDELHDYR